MKILMASICLMMSLNALSQDNVVETENAAEEVSEAVELVATDTSSDNRWSVYGTYAYIDTWLPGKFGITGAYGNDSRTYELAYQKSSLNFDFLIDDLGKVSDTRIHVTTRSHTWDSSFNFQYGLYYNSVEITLGDEYLGAVGQKFSALRVDTLGAMWGVGNRWTWDSGISVGLDWFKIFWPFLVTSKDAGFINETTDEKDKNDVQELVEGISNIPTFTLTHFEIGYRF